MTYVWVYALGPDPDIYKLVERVELELRHAGNSDVFLVGPWKPFSSERQHRGARQIIVLLVCDWQRFTRTDYFVAANALALHESGAALLLPVLAGNAEPGAGAGVWQERYRVIWDRLANAAVGMDGLRSAIEASATSPAHATRTTSIFFSYCHRDEALRDQLAHHLKLLERTGLIESWHDRNIRAGDDWAAEIDAHLYTSDIILLLLSADFFASDYCSEIETEVALERHRAKAARAIPVVLRPVVWQHSPLAALQALPANARPVTSWESSDAAFVNICEGILGSVLAWKDETTADERAVLAPRFSTRKRVMDAAMPAEVEVNKSAMIVVLIRKPSSAGLRTLVASNAAFGIQPEVVRSNPVSLQFPVGTANKPEPLGLSVVVKAPDFDPPEQKRALTLSPDRDSPPLILMLAAKRDGELKALVELYDQDELIASCPLSTRAGVISNPVSPGIVSAAFEVAEQPPRPGIQAPCAQVQVSSSPAPAQPAAEPPPRSKLRPALILLLIAMLAIGFVIFLTMSHR